MDLHARCSAYGQAEVAEDAVGDFKARLSAGAGNRVLQERGGSLMGKPLLAVSLCCRGEPMRKNRMCLMGEYWNLDYIVNPYFFLFFIIYYSTLCYLLSAGGILITHSEPTNSYNEMG